MTNQVPLTTGCHLELHTAEGQKRSYQIEDCCARGAKTMVYHALRLDEDGVQHAVLLKELYPSELSIERRNTELVPSEDCIAAMKAEKARFVSLYRKICSLHTIDTKNDDYSICGADALLIGNGTEYMEVPEESTVTYDQIQFQEESIRQCLMAIQEILIITDALHQNGMLHLDIKPQNLLCVQHGTGATDTRLFKFLDFDTVQSVAEVSSGEQPLYESKSYSAPELRCGRREAICPATDIYSIGAILFERLFGRRPDPTDIRKINRCIQNELQYQERAANVCADFYPCLLDFLRKSLSANISVRFSSCEEALKSIGKLIDFVEYKPDITMETVYSVHVPFTELSEAEYEESLYPFVSIHEDAHTALFKSLSDVIFGVKASFPTNTGKTINLSALDEIADNAHKGRRFLLVGGADSGKSALCRALFSKLRENRTLMTAPMFISAARFGESGESLKSNILKMWFGFLNENDIGMMRKMDEILSNCPNDSPQYMMIVDDLDSMQPNAREKLLRELDGMHYANLRILVALRQDTPFLQNWIRINVLPLETDQILSYLKWNESMAPDERLPVFDLCRNNIRLLKMFAQLKLTSEANTDEEELTQKYLDRMEAKCRMSFLQAYPEASSESEINPIHSTLCAVAQWMLSCGTVYISFDCLAGIIQAISDDDERTGVILKVLSESGFFVIEDDIWSVPQTYRDYYAACGIVHKMRMFCNENISLRENFPLFAKMGVPETVLIFCNKKTLGNGNGIFPLTGEYVDRIQKIAQSKNHLWLSDPDAMALIPFVAFQKAQREPKDSTAKCATVLNILKMMQMYFGEIPEAVQRVLRLQDVNIIPPMDTETDVQLKAYYSTFAPIIGKRVKRRKAFWMGATVAASVLVLFIALYILPRAVLRTPSVVVQESDVSYPARYGSVYHATITDINQTNVLAQNAQVLSDVLSFFGFSGTVSVDSIIDVNTVQLKLIVDEVWENQCSISLPADVLQVHGKLGASKGNNETNVMTFYASADREKPKIIVSVNEKRLMPSYDPVYVPIGSNIQIQAIASALTESPIKYIKYKIGVREVVQEFSDKVVVSVDSTTLRSFSLQVLTVDEAGNYSADRWLWYEFSVIEAAPPSILMTINGQKVEPFTYEPIQAHAGDRVEIKALPSIHSGAPIQYIRYKIGQAQDEYVYGDTASFEVPESFAAFSLQVFARDTSGLAFHLWYEYDFEVTNLEE